MEQQIPRSHDPSGNSSATTYHRHASHATGTEYSSSHASTSISPSNAMGTHNTQAPFATNMCDTRSEAAGINPFRRSSNNNSIPSPTMRYPQFPSTYGGGIDITTSSSSAGIHASHNKPTHKSGLKGTNRNNVSNGSSIAISNSHNCDSDKGMLLFHNGSMSYSHAASSTSQMFPPPANPVVQTDNRLTEDYSRRIHCYISGTQDDVALPSDHMPSPVLPSLQSLQTDQEMPFWRPPRVLQQEPHYNHTPSPNSASATLYRSPLFSQNHASQNHPNRTEYLQILSPHPSGLDGSNTTVDWSTQNKTPSTPLSSVPASPAAASKVRSRHQGDCEHRMYSGKLSAESGSKKPVVSAEHSSVFRSVLQDNSQSLLSPALLAISNSHYEHQRRQNRRALPLDSIVQNSSQDPSIPVISDHLAPAHLLKKQHSPRSTLPSICSLTKGYSVNGMSSVYAHAFGDRDSLGVNDGGESESSGEAFKDVAGLQKSADIMRQKASELRLPPIYLGYMESSNKCVPQTSLSNEGTGNSPPSNEGESESPSELGTPVLGGTRESISIPHLIDAQKPCGIQECQHMECSKNPCQQDKRTNRYNRVEGVSSSITTSLPAAVVNSDEEGQNETDYTDADGSDANRRLAAPPYAMSSILSSVDCRSNTSALSILVQSRKRSYNATDAAMSLHKMARTEVNSAFDNRAESSTYTESASGLLCQQKQTALYATNEVVITCYHAAVAQKSYGGEKRFLCPPPAVLMRGEGHSADIAHHSAMLLSVTSDADLHGRSHQSHLTAHSDQVAQPKQDGLLGAGDSSSSSSRDGVRSSSSSHAPLECRTSFNERNVALFKSLHVTGMQKAKSFRLRLDLLTPSAVGGQLYPHDNKHWQTPNVYASLESDSVAIISKPSKKTAKARNQSSCIRAGSLISLFNRINSQTFRTKYLNVDHNTGRWVAQSHNWSPLEVVVISDKSDGGLISGAKGSGKRPNKEDHNPLFYGSEIVLVESRRNFRSPPMIIQKVERGRLVENARSPVSQMQKIALQLKPSIPGAAIQYLKADVGHYSTPLVTDSGSNVRFDDPDGSPELTFEALENARISRTKTRDAHNEDGSIEIDDAFCWTIVGISGFTYSYSIPSEQLPATCHINTIPRVTDAFLAKEGELALRILDFDYAKMQLQLNGETLIYNNGACGSEQPQQQQLKSLALAKLDATSMQGSDSESANSSADGVVYVYQLPANARPGLLSIRRADGVLYHTKWELKQSTASCTLEAVMCKLDL
ncbi:hypothetical protein BX070DRAFT_249584 [Coemansia spiralis]|nr:hypothetical protein BX070DRAFT_249584 [Coemansia spiralis]